jgi:hypothetical protein
VFDDASGDVLAGIPLVVVEVAAGVTATLYWIWTLSSFVQPNRVMSP